jgi:hypothetical protein
MGGEREHREPLAVWGYATRLQESFSCVTAQSEKTATAAEASKVHALLHAAFVRHAARHTCVRVYVGHVARVSCRAALWSPCPHG